MESLHFQKMTEEELIGTIESNANAQRALPGGSISLVMLLDELKRRLEGGKALDKDAEEPVIAETEPADKAKVTKSKDKITTSESFEKI